MTRQDEVMHFSWPVADAWVLMAALAAYKVTWQGKVRCPRVVDSTIAQVTQRLATGHRGSEVAPALPNANTGPMPRPLLDYSDAAALLGISLATLKRRVADGVFTPVRNGRRVHLRRTDLERFINNGGTPCR